MRVRVDGLLKTSATVRPFERPRGERRRFERGGAVEQQSEPVRVELGAGDEVVWVRALTWNLYHGRSPKPAGTSLLNEFAAALERLGMGRRAAAGGAAVVAAAAGRAPRTRRSATS